MGSNERYHWGAFRTKHQSSQFMFFLKICWLKHSFLKRLSPSGLGILRNKGYSGSNFAYKRPHTTFQATISSSKITFFLPRFWSNFKIMSAFYNNPTKLPPVTSAILTTTTLSCHNSNHGALPGAAGAPIVVILFYLLVLLTHDWATL